MYSKKALTVQSVTTPKKALRRWAIVLRSNPAMVVAGPFETRDQARERLARIALR